MVFNAFFIIYSDSSDNSDNSDSSDNFGNFKTYFSNSVYCDIMRVIKLVPDDDEETEGHEDDNIGNGEIDEIENKENDTESLDLEDMAMEELDSINKEDSNVDSESVEEDDKEKKEDEEEFGEINFDEEDEDEDIDFTTHEKLTQPNECKLTALLDYFFFIYFMVMALFYKELKDKVKFVNNFIEKNKQVIDEIKLRFERFLANNLPKTYKKLIKFEDYTFIFGIAMLTINFHIEVQEAIKQNQQETKQNKQQPEKKPSTTENNTIAIANIDTSNQPMEVHSYDMW